MRHRVIVARLLVLAMVLALGIPSSAADEERSFGRAFERLKGFPERGLFKDGLRKLAALLKKHAKKPYVYGRRAEIEHLAQHLAFANEYGAPRAGDVVSGRVEKWDAQKGYLRIRYTPHTDSDLVERKGLLWLPFHIRGAFLLEVKGQSYPSRVKDSPMMLFGGEPHPKTKTPIFWEVSFGKPPVTADPDEYWLPPAVIEHHDGKKKHAKSETARGEYKIKIGRPYALQMKVTETRVAGALRGRSIGSMPKPRGMWGDVGFDADTWSSATFTGTIEPIWIQARIDKLVQAQRKKFERSYKRTEHLPAWLFEKAPVAAHPAKEPKPAAQAQALPVKLAAPHHDALHRFEDHFERSRWGSALSAVRKMVRAGVEPCVTSYLTARVRARMGQMSKGLENVERSLQTHPKFLGSMLLHGTILRHLGRFEDAAEAFKKAAALHPQSVEAYEKGITELLYASRVEDAQALARQAAKTGVTSDQLSFLGRILVHIESGPTWARSYEHKSRNYHVISDIDKNSCLEASRILEESLTSYRVNFHWVSRDKSRLFRVYLFSGWEGFKRYLRDIGGPEPRVGTAGLYSPMLKHLLIWNLPNREEMLRVVRHEGFHQYLDRLMPDPPIWFNEGFAVYHENAVKDSQGKLVFGQPQPGRIALLKKQRPAYLSEFLFRTPSKFYDIGLPSYAQAWVVAHMLKHGKPAHRKLFAALVKDLQTMHSFDAMKKHFPPNVVQDLETDFRAHLNGLAKR